MKKNKFKDLLTSKQKQSNPPLTIERKKEAIKLYNSFIENYSIDITLRRKDNFMAEYRSLFNYICYKKLRIRLIDIKRIYNELGLVIHHATIHYSLNKFRYYCIYFPEFKVMYEENLCNYDYNNEEFKELIKLIPNDRKIEINKLLRLKIKSWNIKNI